MALQKVGGKALVKTEDREVRKTPPAHPKKVLDEDTFTEDIEKIIVRDFYPDLPKLQAQSDYLDALAHNDTEKLRQIHLKYGPRRGTAKTPNIYSTPATFETPSVTGSKRGGVKQTPRDAAAPDSAASAAEKTNTAVEEEEGEGPTHNPEPEPEPEPAKTDSDLTLDKYLAKNTSEDNAAFEEILQESEEKHRQKHAWLFEQEGVRSLEQEERLALPSIEEQAALKAVPSSAQTWTYKAKNALMYVPAGCEDSAAEKIEKTKGQPRQIFHTNTRFKLDPFDTLKSKEQIATAAQIQAQQLHGKVGADGKEVLPEKTPSVGGYGFMATPSPAPGVDGTPLMTWGEIEGTPFRLDGSDTPLVHRTPGPIFKIAEVPKRDKLALDLAEKASKAHRAKKQEALKRVQANFATPTPKFGSVRTERLAHLTPAAQRLATSKLGVRTHTDKALRASYTPTPTHRLPGDKTPITKVTPSRTPQQGASNTPKVRNTPKRDSSTDLNESLTDNLLNLPKRPKAAEYF